MFNPIGQHLKEIEQFRTHLGMTPQQVAPSGREVSLFTAPVTREPTSIRSKRRSRAGSWAGSGALRALKQALVGPDPQQVIDMQEAPARAPEHCLLGPAGCPATPASAQKVRPALVPGIYILEFQSCLLQVPGERCSSLPWPSAVGGPPPFRPSLRARRS